MIRRFEVDEGDGTKFWEIETRDTVSFTCRWGKVGALGRNERNYAFSDGAAATKAADKLIAERTKKGFALVGGGAPKGKVAPASVPAKPRTAKAGAGNPKLEAMLAENPEDKGTWQVYADWLLENGEPWGEVIAMASTGKLPKKRQDEATSQLLGDLDGSSVSWRFGTIEEVTLCPEEDDGGDDDDDDADDEDDASGGDSGGYAATLARILRHPAGRLVRTLELGLPPGMDSDWSYQPILPALMKFTLPLLQSIDMTADAEFMDQDSWRGVGDLRKLWAVAPRLRELHLKGSCGTEKTRLGDIVAPYLEKLVHISSGMGKAVPEDLGRATLPELRHLELYLGQEDYGFTCKLKSFAGIFEGKGLPKLQYLGLVNSEWESNLVTALAKAPIVKRLKTLDLSKGTLWREGAAALLEHAAGFRHLEKLDLDDNYIEDEQQAAIKKAIPCAHFGDQREIDDPEDPTRYCSVGE